MATPPSSDALVVTSGPLSGQTLPLPRRELVVGRDASCDLPLTTYTRLSRRHARLVPTGEGWKIEDLGSTNGVLLDGKPVKDAALHHGSHLKLGDFEALVRVYSAPQPEPQVPIAPPVPGSGSPAIAPTSRKTPKWLWPALGVMVLLLGTGLFFGGHSSSTVDTNTEAKVRRALDTGDASDDDNTHNGENTQNGDTQTNPPGAPATGGDTATQPTVAAAPPAQMAPPVNGRIAPATIAVAKSATVLIMRPEGNGLAFGSGFVTGNGHQVVTNHHVVADGSMVDDCILIFGAGTSDERKVKVPASDIQLATGTDQFSADLALLTIPDDVPMPAPLSIGSSEELSEVDTTWVFGFPLGVQTLTLDQELPSVSVKNASIERVQRGKVDGIDAAKVIQLGSTVTHGNSGGPVLNTKGEVVGVISLGAEGTGISYAIPTIWIKRLVSGG